MIRIGNTSIEGIKNTNFHWTQAYRHFVKLDPLKIYMKTPGLAEGFGKQMGFEFFLESVYSLWFSEGVGEGVPQHGCSRAEGPLPHGLKGPVNQFSLILRFDVVFGQ